VAKAGRQSSPDARASLSEAKHAIEKLVGSRSQIGAWIVTHAAELDLRWQSANAEVPSNFLSGTVEIDPEDNSACKFLVDEHAAVYKATVYGLTISRERFKQLGGTIDPDAGGLKVSVVGLGRIADTLSHLVDMAKVSLVGSSVDPLSKMTCDEWLINAARRHPQRADERDALYLDRLHNEVMPLDRAGPWARSTLESRFYELLRQDKIAPRRKN
jgi:hypothetical protein